MTEDEIRLAAEALGVIPRSKTRPKSLEVPPGGLSQAQRQTQQTLSEGIKSAAERREAEESEAWGKKVEETTTPSEKILGGLEAAVALPSGAAMGILGQLGEGFKLLPQGGTNQFVAENTFLPRTEAGQRYFDVWAGGVEKAADWFGDTPLGEFLGDAFEKVPGIFPVSAATTKAVDDGLAGGVKGLKLAAEQARKQRQYETGQEGAFYRVRPVTEETGRALRGNKEEAGGGAETPGGPVRGDVPQPITDDALTEIMAQPDNFVRSVASDYAQQVNGRPYELPDMAPSSLLKQAPIGRVFDLAVSENPQYKKAVFEAYGRSMPEVIEQSGAKNYDQLVEAAYRQLAKETDDQFRRLPVNMSYHRAGEGNYSDSRDMLRDVYGNRHLYVFQGGDPHPFMSRVDPETGLNDNEKFRAVHDFFGHAIHGNQFGPKGEETAWLAHSQMYSPLARLAMSTETRGQNSVVNYTPLNAKLKARLSEIEGRIYESRRRGQTDDLKELQDIKKGLFNQFQFAPQYGLLLPPEMIRPDFAGKMPDYVRPLIQPAPGTATGARLFHYGKEPGIKVTDPSKYGTGIKGAEAIRLEGAPDIRPRTYFYTDPTKPPEAGLGPYRYRGEADLYNLEEDPLAFRTLAAESLRSPFTSKVNPGMVDPSEAITATERLVKEYGYPGYMTPESGTAAVFQPVPVRRYAEGGAVNPFEVPTPENLALDPILAEEREMRRLKRAQEMAKRPLAEKAKGALEAAQTTASTVGRGVLRPFAELAGQAFGEKGMGERLVQSAPQPQTEVGKHYTGEVQDVMQEVGKFLEPAKIPQGPYMPELIPSLPYANRPQMLTQKLEEEFATPPIGAVQLQTQQAPRNPLGMYSQAEQVALNLPQQKGTGNQFLAQISKTPGVKPAELEWTGLADFLKSKGDQPVTKQEIQQHLDANRVQVEEVQLGDTLEARELDRWLDNWADKNPDTKTSDAIMRGLSFDEIAQVAKSENQPVVARLIGNQNNPAKYSQYQLPGGSNYREVLLTLPEPKEAAIFRELELRVNAGDRLTPQERQKYYDLVDAKAFENQFFGTHFNQANILAHMRLNDRLDADGNRVLFVEEIQSDWGQQGREKGFVPKNIEAQLKEGEERMRVRGLEIRSISDRMAALDDTQLEEFNRLADERQRLQDLQGQEIDWGNSLYDARSSGAPSAPFVSTQQYQVMKDGKPLVTKNKENKDVQHVYDSPEDAQRAAQKFGGEVKDLGMQENTEGWVNLSLKRLITDAVNNGYKKVAFINGEQSADRYKLSKKVDQIDVFDRTNAATGEKSKSVRFDTVDGMSFKVGVNKEGEIDSVNDRQMNFLVGKSLDDVVGKDMAKRILEGGDQSIYGERLDIGGEGMKKFYDQIVPATANKLLKKLGGGKLEPIDFPAKSMMSQEGYALTAVPGQKTPKFQQLGFTITPEMVELVKNQGLPMFAAGGAVTMAKGGKVAKGMSGISAAREAMKAQRSQKGSQELSTEPADSVEKPRAPEIKKSGKLTQVEKELLERGGERQAKRLQRAADEIPGLEDQYQSNALIRAFLGRKGYPYQGVMTMRPGDFEEFAKYLGPLGQYSKENIENLRNVLAQGGSFDDVPFLMMDRKDNIPFIAGHEGRHRTRALEAERRPKTLVEVYPRRGLEMGADDMPMKATEWLKRFNEALGKDRLVVPEDYDPATTVDALKKALPDVYAKGGKVTKGALSGLSSAREAMKAQRREERVQKNLEAYMGSTEKPQTYYHATQAPKDFRKFDLEKRPTPKSAAAVFLTPSTEWANEFDMADLKTLESATSAAPRIMPMITRAKNTFDYEDPGHVTQVMNQVELPPGIDRQHVADEIAGGNWNFIEDRNIQKAIKDLGFDSFNVKEKGVKNLGVFNPADVKALFNRGSYDPTTEDISKAAGGPVLKGIAKARAEAKMATGGKAVKGADSALSGIAAARAAQKAQRASKLEEALEAKQPPMTTPQGTGLPLMPRDQGMYIPGVKQEDLPRMPKVDKARAAGKKPEYTERMEDLLQSRAAKKKVDTLIQKGDALGMREWYGIEPLRQVAMDIGMSPEKFKEFIAQMSSASQRNPVDQQNRMGSYLWHLSQTGGLPSNAFLYTNKMRRGKQGLPEGTPIELPSGYGSLAQGDIFNRGLQIARGDIEGALPPDKKLGTFYRTYLGNLRPVTVDVNAVRGPIIEYGDPRWLASKLVEKDEEGNVIGTYFPRKAVQSGLMSIKQAKERPGFWEAAPSGSEYAGFEDLWQSAAKRFGIQPAEAQALGWYGSADVTALKTKPELYIENLERMIRRTAEQTGQNPRQVMENMLRGTEYLRKKGGLVRS